MYHMDKYGVINSVACKGKAEYSLNDGILGIADFKTILECLHTCHEQAIKRTNANVIFVMTVWFQESRICPEPWWGCTQLQLQFGISYLRKDGLCQGGVLWRFVEQFLEWKVYIRRGSVDWVCILSSFKEWEISSELTTFLKTGWSQRERFTWQEYKSTGCGFSLKDRSFRTNWWRNFFIQCRMKFLSSEDGGWSFKTEINKLLDIEIIKG